MCPPGGQLFISCCPRAVGTCKRSIFVLHESFITHGHCLNWKAVAVTTLSRLGNSVTGFMISDESGNRFFPTAVTDYWQDRAGIAYQQTDFSRICAHFPVWNCQSRVTLPFEWVWFDKHTRNDYCTGVVWSNNVNQCLDIHIWICFQWGCLSCELFTNSFVRIIDQKWITYNQTHVP